MTQSLERYRDVAQMARTHPGIEGVVGIAWISPHRLLPHERTRPDRLLEIIMAIRTEGSSLVPIAVEENSLAIMDGHHRREAAIHLRLKSVPCLLLSYDDVAVEALRPDQDVSPGEIIARAKAGRLFPPKTTRHRLPNLPALPLYPPKRWRRGD